MSDRAFRAPPSVMAILGGIATEYGVTIADLRGHGKTRLLCVARQEAYARIRTDVIIGGRPASYPQIGVWLGGRDHSTIIYGIREHLKRSRLAEAA